MRPVILICISAFIFLQASCSKAVKFPVSPITPAATITAEKEKDKNNNYEIAITAKDMASATRLNPARNTYVVWAVTEKNGVQNIGQLEVSNAGKTSLNALTPYNVTELFITAEDQATVAYPKGVEISRLRFD